MLDHVIEEKRCQGMEYGCDRKIFEERCSSRCSKYESYWIDLISSLLFNNPLMNSSSIYSYQCMDY